MSEEDKGFVVEAFGQWLNAQRKLADLSLRQLAELTDVSATYLSQLERGLHEPSLRVVRSIASSLNVSMERVLEQLGLVEEDLAEGSTVATEAAIKSDPVLSTSQKEALLAVYRSYVAEQNAD